MEFVKKCKKVLGSNKRLHPENNGSGSYGRLRKKEEKKQSRVAPQGCLCVYVGAERERFVIKIKIANHPLFKALLDAAEKEYGYRNDGPLWLPCHVDFFCEALAEMESTHDDMGSVGCAFPLGHGQRHNPSSPSNLTCRYLSASVIHHYQTLNPRLMKHSREYEEYRKYCTSRPRDKEWVEEIIRRSAKGIKPSSKPRKPQ